MLPRRSFNISDLRPGAVGTLTGTDSMTLTEMVSTLGFDFLFTDCEHGDISERGLVSHVLASEVPVFARLSDCAEVPVKLAADAGVSAIVVPHVGSAQQAGRVVSWAKYAPAGLRSVGLSRNTLLGADLAHALQCTDTPAVIAQIEDIDGVRNVEGICRTVGIDGVFIGPYDLSVSLGGPGDFECPKFTAAIGAVADSAHTAGISVGVYAPSVSAWHDFRRLGCDYVVLSAVSLFVVDGARRVLSDARRHLVVNARTSAE